MADDADQPFPRLQFVEDDFAARESAFTQCADEVRRSHDERLLATRAGCGATRREAAACDTRLRAVMRDRDEELAALDRQRLASP